MSPTQVQDQTAIDEQWMSRAIELGWQGKYTTTPNPNVGCVIVKDGNIVGEGCHLKAGEPHAEVHALAQAGPAAQGATAYVSLEPCSHYGRTPPCCEVLIAAGIKRVVIANVDPFPKVSGRGIQRLQEHGIEVVTGVLAQQASKLNTGFFKRMQTGQPLVRLKMAASLDGRIALANGTSQWITGPEARQDVQAFRAQSCAVLTGSGTIRADNPSLLFRPEQALLTDYPDLPNRQPVRVVVDSQRALSTDYQLFQDGFKTIVATTQQVGTDDNSLSFWQLPKADEHVSLPALLDKMGEAGFNQVWVECGSVLAGKLLSQQLVDEVIVYLAPKLIGNSGLPLVNLPQYTQLADCPALQLIDTKVIGQDVRLTYQITSE